MEILVMSFIHCSIWGCSKFVARAHWFVFGLIFMPLVILTVIIALHTLNINTFSCEIRNEPAKAEMYMKRAATSKYATGNGSFDYMSSCAKVHCKMRGWEV